MYISHILYMYKFALNVEWLIAIALVVGVGTDPIQNVAKSLTSQIDQDSLKLRRSCLVLYLIQRAERCL